MPSGGYKAKPPLRDPDRTLRSRTENPIDLQDGLELP